ncbi:MAG: alcohol dehydrogenase catalytic domain-containing protein [Actinobacteria bacterium]|jgi:(R,R)-butanediol dehydrogenase/meso-butanediol dehydrogenase/diacetyl reductase/L-iditol 2-dehydrogenase|nr:alcohol dehydrogenase catalytic domain-containing protein [Actinomycetota bacterium]
MKAALTYGPFDTRVEEVPEPTPGPGEVKVKIAYCGICGSDPEIYEGTFGLLKAPWWPPAPFSTGHEASGVIAELGPGLLGDWKVGQRVAMNFRKYCGACYYCRNKMEQFCEYVKSYEAGFAEYAVYDESCLYSLPDDVSLERGAMLEPVTIAVHAVDLGNIAPGKTVAVSGAGTIGLLIQQIAIRAGAARVLVSDPMPEKREMAKLYGADWTVDPLKEDLVTVGRQHTDGRGFDTVFEASGNFSAVEQTIGLADKDGTIVWAGSYHEDATFPINPYYMFANELTIRSTILAPFVFPRALKLLAKLDLEPMITQIVPLADIATALAARKTSTDIKILVKP